MSKMILAKLPGQMKDAKMRAEDLASKTGLSFRTVMSALQGKQVSYSTAELIARALKKKREDLA